MNGCDDDDDDDADDDDDDDAAADDHRLAGVPFLSSKKPSADWALSNGFGTLRSLLHSCL